MKLALKPVVATLVVLALAGVGIGLSVDRFVGAAIERGGGHALGVELQVGSTDVGIANGRIHLEDLVVGNPEGFASSHFLHLARGSVEVELESLLDDVMVLPSVTLAGVDVNLERKAGQWNHEVILDNVDKRKEDGDAGGTPSKESRGYLVRELVLEDVTVHADLLAVGGELVDVALPVEQIRVTGLGSGSDHGLLLWELTGVLVKAILAAVMEKGPELPLQLLDSLKQDVRELEDLGIGIAFELGQDAARFEESVEEVRQALEDLGNGVEARSKEPPGAAEGDGPR